MGKIIKVNVFSYKRFGPEMVECFARDKRGRKYSIGIFSSGSDFGRPPRIGTEGFIYLYEGSVNWHTRKYLLKLRRMGEI